MSSVLTLRCNLSTSWSTGDRINGWEWDDEDEILAPARFGPRTYRFRSRLGGLGVPGDANRLGGQFPWLQPGECRTLRRGDPPPLRQPPPPPLYQPHPGDGHP